MANAHPAHVYRTKRLAGMVDETTAIINAVNAEGAGQTVAGDEAAPAE